MQQRTIDTRREIISAATEEFAHYGFDGASTRNIASRAGVKHTLVTYHFVSKEGLWQAAVSHLFEQYRQSHNQSLEEHEIENDTERLRMSHAHFIRFAAVTPNLQLIMNHVGSQPTLQLKWLKENILKDLFDERVRLIKNAQNEGRFIQGDPFHPEYRTEQSSIKLEVLWRSLVGRIDKESPVQSCFGVHTICRNNFNN